MRLLLTLLAAVAITRAQDYATEIHPLLLKRCGACHSQGAKVGDFELNTYEQLLKGGNHGTPILRGNATDSLLVRMITGQENPTMPMDGTFLSAGEIDLIKRWINAGAKGPTPEQAAKLAIAAVRAEAPVIKPRAVVRPQIFASAIHGSIVALAGHREVRLVTLPDRKPAAALPGHAGPVRALAFSPNGKLLAAAGGTCAKKGEVKVWDVEKRSAVLTVSGHDDCIYGVAFSPDGTILATSSYDKLIKLWDAASGREVRTLKDHIDAVYALEFTPDGKLLVSGSADRTVKIWEVATGKRLYTLSEATDGINSVAIDPAGNRVAAGGLDKSVRVWSLGASGGELLHTLMAHEDAILKVAWSPDGKQILTSAADRSIKLLDAATLSELKNLPNQSDWTYGVHFTADGRQLFLGRMDGSTDFVAMR
ncbi:MAG: hypothetical protein FJW39_20075 [Acidobacteria bacterium]|nr:hypothetical protein [Acidobacteriota bacterium]